MANRTTDYDNIKHNNGKHLVAGKGYWKTTKTISELSMWLTWQNIIFIKSYTPQLLIVLFFRERLNTFNVTIRAMIHQIRQAGMGWSLIEKVCSKRTELPLSLNSPVHAIRIHIICTCRLLEKQARMHIELIGQVGTKWIYVKYIVSFMALFLSVS